MRVVLGKVFLEKVSFYLSWFFFYYSHFLQAQVLFDDLLLILGHSFVCNLIFDLATFSILSVSLCFFYYYSNKDVFWKLSIWVSLSWYLLGLLDLGICNTVKFLRTEVFDSHLLIRVAFLILHLSNILNLFLDFFSKFSL